MTNDEIKEARKKILSTIGPRALEKLKNINAEYDELAALETKAGSVGVDAKADIKRRKEEHKERKKY